MSAEPSKDPILGLVEWIEEKRAQKANRLFRENDAFEGAMKQPIFLLITLFLVVAIVAYGFGMSLASQGLYDFKAMITITSAMLPALAVVIASLALFNPYFEKNEVKVRYGRALNIRKKEVESGSNVQDFTDNEKPFLWALIEIGSKNQSFNLKQMYDCDKTKTLFSEEKLLDRLRK